MANIKRRKFTLPDDLDQRIVELAEEHKSDNVSRFIRCAIKSYEASLNEQDSQQEVLSTLGEFRQEIGELRQAVEQLDNGNRIAGSSPTKSEIQGETKPNPTSVQRSVQSVLLDEGSLELPQLVEAIDYDVLETQEAIESLIEKGLLKKESSNEMVEYKIKK